MIAGMPTAGPCLPTMIAKGAGAMLAVPVPARLGALTETTTAKGLGEIGAEPVALTTRPCIDVAMLKGPGAMPTLPDPAKAGPCNTVTTASGLGAMNCAPDGNTAALIAATTAKGHGEIRAETGAPKAPGSAAAE